MTRGTQDGRIETFTIGKQVSDLGSVYSMLLGFSPLEGTGRVIYLDTFKNGLGSWFLSKVGTGLLPALYSTVDGTIFMPPNSVRFDSGNVASDKSIMTRNIFLRRFFYTGGNQIIPLVSTYKLGFETVLMSAAAFASDFFITIDFAPEPNAYAWVAQLRFTASNGKWALRTTSGAFVNINDASSTPLLPTNSWMQIKIVADFLTGQYARLFIGDQVYDISSVSMDVSTNAARLATYQIRTSNFGSIAGEYMHIGYVLLTKDDE
jgi:hypothetical protein